ncbi:putative SUMO-activating enzyme subunit uba-2 [Blattamonas nauphoetae]|uniref:SUMO-activating enzyme subunit n=1 Tax=Blattamonas nauphoetae TaxID=2049346 RepID=A0ABQ9X3U9_9EUKA|nr:putative SUMO-activating enzyme subunit uba-2 [Blattamonas nauphoetae]
MFNASLTHKRIFVVGAGGIGCEVLKTLAASGFRHLTIIDLDTIDVSNLNRQFLFRKEHIGQSKAHVSRSVLLERYPDAHIISYQENVKSPRFNLQFYQQFDCVICGLDNVDTRRHVNRMCIISGVPLIDGGTAGLTGQSKPVLKGKTECFDCTVHAAPTHYAVCTIRASPTQPVHCIVWAQMLYNLIFGPPESNFNNALDDGEKATPLMVPIWKVCQATNGVVSEKDRVDLWKRAIDVFTCSFSTELKERNEVLDKNMVQAKPILDLLKGDLDVTTLSPDTCSSIDETFVENLAVHTLPQLAKTFIRTFYDLSIRQLTQHPTQDTSVLFDKDDSLALNFIYAASSLRSINFNIKRETRHSVKAIVGNIVPAVASTNAVVGGLTVLELIKFLTISSPLQNDLCYTVVQMRESNHRLLSASAPADPNPECPTCSLTYHICDLNPSISLKNFVDSYIRGTLTIKGDFSLSVSTPSLRVLYDSEMEEEFPLDKSLSALGVADTTLVLLDQCCDTDTPVSCGIYFSLPQPTPQKRTTVSGGLPKEEKTMKTH